MNQTFAEHKALVDAAVQNYGWLDVLRALTPLTSSISGFKPGQGKGGVTISATAHDKCPCCNVNKASNKKFHLHHDADLTGGGHCWRSGENFDGYQLIMAYNRWDFSTAFKEVKKVINFNPKDQSPRIEPKPVVQEEYQPTENELRHAKFLKQQMEQVWQGTLPFNAPESLPAQLYIEGRGLPYRGQMYNNQVRFHPGLDYFIAIPNKHENEEPEDTNYREALTNFALQHPKYVRHTKYADTGLPRSVCMGKHPCIVMMLRNGKTGEPKRLHRIYISTAGKKIEFDGKFKLSAKKMMGGGYGNEINCAAVHLSPAGSPIIGLAEGYETGEAAIVATGMPLHVTINASGIGGYYPTRGTKIIFIFEDKDRSKTGEKQSLKLIERLSIERPEIKVIRLVVPDELADGQKSIDWLNMYNKYGLSCFPAIARQWHSVLS